MRAIIITIAIVFTNLIVFSQNIIKFKYDAAGNRTDRYIDLSTKSTEINTIENTDTTFFNEQEQAFSEKYSLEESYVDQIGEQKITIYPNPTGGQIVVHLENYSLNNAIIKLYDLNGKLILNRRIRKDFSLIDITNAPNGIYVMKIYIGDNTSDWKIVKK